MFHPNKMTALNERGFVMSGLSRMTPMGLSLKDFGKLVGSTVKETVTVVSDEDADIWVGAILTANFGEKPAAENGSAVAQKTKSKNVSLEPEDVYKALVSCASALRVAPVGQIGTHSPKIPNPDMSMENPAVFKDADLVYPKTSGVFGITNTSRKISASGNAASAPVHKFLTSAYRSDSGDVVCVLDDLLDDGPIAKAIKRYCGGGNNTWSDILGIATAVDGRRKGSCDPGYIDPSNKTILWSETENGGYISITPIANLPLTMEIQSRISQRIAEDQAKEKTLFYPDRKMKVGGTKPANAGIMASDRGGWFRLLRCLPPRPFNREETLRGFANNFLVVEKLRTAPTTRTVRLLRDKLLTEIVERIVRYLQERERNYSRLTVIDAICKRSPIILNETELGRLVVLTDQYIRKII